MAQDGTTAGGASYTIDNVTFPVGRTKLNSIFSAIRSTNKGGSAPSGGLVAGQFWIDDSNDPTWTLYLFDGTDSIQFCTINTTDNSVNFIDSAFDLVVDTTPQLGGDLDLNSNDITGTGNINITGNITASGNLAGTLTTASQPNITSVGTLTSFTSTGIDDNATSTAITIDSSENVGIGADVPSSQLTVGSGGTANPPSFAQIHSNATDKYFLKLTSTNFNSASNWIGLGIGYSNNYLKSAIIGEAQDAVARTKLHFCCNSSAGSTNASISDKRMSIDYNGDISFYEDTGTTPKFFWDASEERLLIGATSASNLNTFGDDLIVSNTTSGSGSGISIISNATNGYSSVYFGDTDDTDIGRIQYHNLDNSMTFRTNASDALVIDSSGNVGIGTSNPSSLVSGSRTLEVSDPSGNGAEVIIANQNSGLADNDIVGTLAFKNFDSSGTTPHYAGIRARAESSFGRMDLEFYAGRDVLESAGTPHMVIEANNGNVGIGTSSPAEELDISADAPSVQLSSTNASGRNYGLQSTNTGNFAFYDGTAGTNRMVIDSSGNVGIGATSPASNLEVYKSVSVSGASNQNVLTVTAVDNNGGFFYAGLGAGIALRSGKTSASAYGPEIMGAIYGANTNDESVSNGYLTFHTRLSDTLSERMRITNTGRVGIGTSSPSDNMEISQSNNNGATLGLQVHNTNTGTVGNYAGIYATAVNGLIGMRANAVQTTFKSARVELGSTTAHPVSFVTSDTERMRIDSSGNVLVGKTSSNFGTAGVQLQSNGELYVTRNGGNPVSINRLSSDGIITNFAKDGTSVGSIGSSAGNYLTIGNNVNTRLRFTASDIRPCDSSGADRDNAIDLGDGVVGARFKDFYLAGNIYLGGTGSANALDDYEEGTWSPIIKGTTSTGTATYTVQAGFYTKIGRMVHIQGFLNYSSGTGTGNLIIEGLPFITNSTAETYSSLSIGYFHNIAYTTDRTPMIYVNHNGSQRLVIGQSNPAGAWLAIPYDGTGQIIFSGTYITN